MSRSTAPAATMFQELKFQLSTAILTILTLAAGVAAFINFQQQNRFRLPEDGVIWVDRQGSVEALYVKPASPGLNAGIHARRPPAGYRRRTDRARHRCGQSAGTDRRLEPGQVPAAEPRRGTDGDAGGGGTAARPRGHLPVRGRHGLPDHRAVRLFPPRQRAQGAAFLYSLPGVFHLSVLSLHRPVQHLRQGDLFRQPGGGPAGADRVPAFLPDVSGAAPVVPRARRARFCSTCRRP